MELIIPEGQMTRWVLNNYYQQPEGSNITEAQSIHHRHYFNTLFRNETDWNRNENSKLFRHLYGNNREKYVQNIRKGYNININCLADAASAGDLNDNIVVNAYKLDGSLINSVTPYIFSQNVNNINFATSYSINVRTTQDTDGKLCLYFMGGVPIQSNMINETQYFSGNIPESINIGDTCIFDIPAITTSNIIDIVFLSDLNVMALKFNINYLPTMPSAVYLSHYYQRSEYNSNTIVLKDSDLPQNQCFYLAIEFYSDKVQTELNGTWESELMIYETDLPNNTLFTWYDKGRKIGLIEWNISYNLTLINSLFLPDEYYNFTVNDDTNELFFNETGGSRLLSAQYKRVYTLNFTEPLPRYIFETLRLAFMHSYFFINNKRFVANLATFEIARAENSMMFTGLIEVSEYETTGVNDTTGYDFIHTKPSPYEYLKIDSNEVLNIDEDGHKLRIS